MNPSVSVRTVFLATGILCAVCTPISASEYEVAQNAKRFMLKGKQVEKITIQAGDTIRFKNEDRFFHNIFSLSEILSFDLGSFPKGDSRTVTFDKAGIAELECAIHPEMSLTVEVK
jgi:plastocyanin